MECEGRLVRDEVREEKEGPSLCWKMGSICGFKQMGDMI